MAASSAEDRARALFVAGIEIAVRDIYRDLLDQGGLDPDVADTVLVLAQHHDEHAAALAALGRTPRSSVHRNVALHAELTRTVLGAHPLSAIVDVEEALVATHLASLGMLTSAHAAAAVAAILPIESDHAVVVGVAAGRLLASTELLPALESTARAYDDARYPPS